MRPESLSTLETHTLQTHKNSNDNELDYPVVPRSEKLVDSPLHWPSLNNSHLLCLWNMDYQSSLTSMGDRGGGGSADSRLHIVMLPSLVQSNHSIPFTLRRFRDCLKTPNSSLIALPEFSLGLSGDVLFLHVVEI